MYRELCRKFYKNNVMPYHAQWEKDGEVSRCVTCPTLFSFKNCRELWRQAGEAGMLGVTVPEEFGGAGLDILYSSVHWEEQAYAGATGPVRHCSYLRSTANYS